MRKKTSPIWTISTKDLKIIVKNSNTMADVLRKISLDPSASGSRYRSLKNRLRESNINFSHISLGPFSRQGKGYSLKTIPLDKVMIKNSTYDRGHLKRRLLKNGMLKNECYNCGFPPFWEGKKLVLVLDHINGIRNDNELENLRLLCPNCNSQQDTFAGKKNKKPDCICKNCNTKISRRSKSKLCKSCYGTFYVPRKVKNRPSKEQLLQEIKETNYCVVGRKYGVSDNTIRKWIK